MKHQSFLLWLAGIASCATIAGCVSDTGSLAREPGEERDFEIARGVKMTFCWVPATTSAAWKRLSGGKDTFLMGSPGFEVDAAGEETPHEVCLTRGYWLGKYEVTQAQWGAVMGSNPTYFGGAQKPVEQVSWDDCQEFIRRLGQGYRLPTEAEWEYACRAGTTGRYAGDLDRMAWYGKNSGDTTHPVGQKEANAWGLHDMYGNVCEWCSDWGGDYSTGRAVNPVGPASGLIRVFRGGGWVYPSEICRSAYREGSWPNTTGFHVGFRLVRDAL